MRQNSHVRDWLIAVYQKKGWPQSAYFVDVFERWMRMFGPEVAIAPRTPEVYDCQYPGFKLLRWNVDGKRVQQVAQNISQAIPHFSTERSFWSEICFKHADDDLFKVYFKGKPYLLVGRAVVRRFSELFMLYSIISAPHIVDDAMSGVGRMMKGFDHA